METVNSLYDIVEEKDIKNTKLYIRRIKINHESYEMKLLSEESIEDILKPHLIYDSEEMTLFYDVSATISLEDYLLNNKLSKADICSLVVAIDRILTSLENYLISEGSLSLDPRLIRVAKKERSLEKIKFIVIPNFNTDFSYDLSKLLIKILRYVDITDKDALNLAYGLFVRSSKKDYVIGDLLELVDEVVLKNKSSLVECNLDDYAEYDESLASEFGNIDFEEALIDADCVNNEVDQDGGLDIDDDTMNILDEEMDFDFDKADKKIIKFNKGLKKRKNKFLNAHIDIEFLLCLFVPVLMVVVPVVYYSVKGTKHFFDSLSQIVVYEVAVLLVVILGRMINYKVKQL